MKRIETIIENKDSDLLELVRQECRHLSLQITEETHRIEPKAKQIASLAIQTDTARRLQTVLVADR